MEGIDKLFDKFYVHPVPRRKLELKHQLLVTEKSEFYQDFFPILPKGVEVDLSTDQKYAYRKLISIMNGSLKNDLRLLEVQL